MKTEEEVEEEVEEEESTDDSGSSDEEGVRRLSNDDASLQWMIQSIKTFCTFIFTHSFTGRQKGGQGRNLLEHFSAVK